ncbi:hypothetical protein [Lactococcus lactis]|jgi:hypothetical protein|nr:hypothetical protein [Lactococcus lactis]WDA67604.1 hypothetical protein IL310_01715 [Lactococcus lactis]
MKNNSSGLSATVINQTKRMIGEARKKSHKIIIVDPKAEYKNER